MQDVQGYKIQTELSSRIKTRPETQGYVCFTDASNDKTKQREVELRTVRCPRLQQDMKAPVLPLSSSGLAQIPAICFSHGRKHQESPGG